MLRIIIIIIIIIITIINDNQVTRKMKYALTSMMFSKMFDHNDV